VISRNQNRLFDLTGNLEAQLTESLLALDMKSPAFPKAKIPCFVTTPHEENPNFLGRDDILNEIHTALAPTEGSTPLQRTFALSGLGGMGKTQIAIEYAFRHRDTYKVILWAHADGEAKLAESFCMFAEELGLAGSEKLSPERSKQVVKGCLAALGMCSAEPI
jgi:hypothetical protein